MKQGTMNILFFILKTKLENLIYNYLTICK